MMEQYFVTYQHCVLHTELTLNKLKRHMLDTLNVQPVIILNKIIKTYS